MTKLANNMLSAAHRMISFEALALAAKNGVDPGRALDILLASSGGNFFLETFARSHLLTREAGVRFHPPPRVQGRAARLPAGRRLGRPHARRQLGQGVLQVCMNELGREEEANASALVMDRLAGTDVVPLRSEMSKT